MYLVFENDIGTLVMAGKSEADISIIEAEGFAGIEKERTTVKFSGYDGVTQTVSSYPDRTITLKGDIHSAEVLKKAMRVFSQQGLLTIQCHDGDRAITVNSVKTDIADKNSLFWTLVIQMKCDYPLFCDSNFRRYSISERTNLITDDTVLPAMFTRRVINTSVENGGYVDVEPIVEILGVIKQTGDNALVISNALTGRCFTLNYIPQADELISIDVKKRSAISSLNGDIQEYIDSNSYFDDLVLKPGINPLTLTCGTSELNASLKYKNEYIEAYL